jgi:phage gpG-like protein
MAFRFRFEIDGVVQFDRAFNRIQGHVEDLTPVWDKVEQAFYRIEREQFDSEGAAGRGGKWAPLSRPYAQQKADRYGVKPIERASDRLYASLTRKGGDTVLVKSKDEFAIGTSLPYAKYQQQGTSKMPKRELISFSDGQRTDLMKEVQKGLLTIIKRDRQVTQVFDLID